MSLARRSILAALLLPLPAAAESCCGPVTPAGRQLLQRLDASGVDHLWLPHEPVNWQTGATLEEAAGGRRASTHCSAFVASFAKQAGVYILRPPEHTVTLLANAQMHWLTSDGQSAGWSRLPDATAAQASANQGNLVVAVYENPDRRKAGHIAFVRPGQPDAARLAAEGPDVTQAGAVNALALPARRAFGQHSGAWPNQIRYFQHAVAWS